MESNEEAVRYTERSIQKQTNKQTSCHACGNCFSAFAEVLGYKRNLQHLPGGISVTCSLALPVFSEIMTGLCH